ncbi:MAG: hypothetical protein EHM20_04030 [Alphaproteobacteria bacterium]|nr:MAG: hypothetical protein EHM20_04030 [Alphaproteobacteria bacterium]
MNNSPKSLLLVLALIVLAPLSNSWAQTEQSQEIDDIAWEITEGKISAVMENNENELRKSVNDKQLEAIKLINIVGSKVNERFSSDLEKGDAEDAYQGFITRFQIIHDERAALDKKEIMPDYKTLQNYSQRLERLISDINKFLK